MASPLRVAVIGLGRAGNARVRDIPVVAPCTAGMEHITLAGFVSRRSLGQAESGAKQLSLDEVLSSSDGVNAVVIATENASHEQFIRQALVAKKHVCVDFPLVPDAATAKELLKLAKDNGVVLYEEDIAMLQDKYEAAKKLVNSKGKMIRAEVNMSVGGTAWLEDIASSGSPFHTSMDILHTMVDYFGDLTPLTCTVVTNDKGTQASGTLSSKEGGEVVININLVKERMRSKNWKYTFENGEIVDDKTEVEDLSEKNKALPKPLFMRDMLQFAQTVAGLRDHSHNEWLTIRCLEIADSLWAMSQK
ncbi:hypothetical protein CAPTEDRAFT_220255 [Capitella teleta]|uniref:Gfo/Idh/MocA-like oxidoreductase N-terminal domain-containing protein n=1 Tax=Capitella teleta TaxID=283909 RepID=R7VKX2_CAPTE|nr:hypothetical protein CAPTEDRAFT_220255 [Capitella teleta]|eukprot:ELU17746.1 hypothetical protein CAPTEDRAFT_220255 [Capitella teleta]